MKRDRAEKRAPKQQSLPFEDELAAGTVSDGRTMRQRCYAHDCRRPIPAGLLMCRDHWRLVPKELQDRVWQTWRAYSSGRSGSEEWLEAAKAARDAI